MSFKYKGNTNEVQGIRFEKNGYTFNGSKIDRQFSFSKIDYQLNRNEREHDKIIRHEQSHSQNQPSVLESVGSTIGGLFDFQSAGTDYDPDEEEFQRLHKPKKKNQKRGHSL